jgi:hypothetical protein
LGLTPTEKNIFGQETCRNRGLGKAFGTDLPKSGALQI